MADITNNISNKIANVESEAAEEIQSTIHRLIELGINRFNCYMYMQGHSIFNLVCRIGAALFGESFEYQILIPSFSIDNDYQELRRIKEDVISVLAENT